MSMKTIARAFADAFEQRKRDNGEEFYCLADSAPQWMTDAVQAAHDGRLPNDADYGACSDIAAAIAEVLEAGEDLDDARHERVDGLVPVYNHDRLAWLAAHGDFVGYCDESAGLVGAEAGIIERIGAGMYTWLDSVWQALADAIEEQADQEDDEDDNTDE